MLPPQVSTVIRQNKAQGQLCQISPLEKFFEIGFRNILWYTGTLVIDAEQNKFSIVFKINCYCRVGWTMPKFSTRLETTLSSAIFIHLQSLDISIFGFICKFILFSEKVSNKASTTSLHKWVHRSLSRIKYKSLVGFYLSSECIQNVELASPVF